MRIVSAQEQEKWLEDGQVLEKDSRGPKVLLLEDGLILKIFHTRRHVLLNRLTPPAQVFSRNGEILANSGICVPEIVETFWLDKDKGLSACRYRPLPGESIESLFKRNSQQIEPLLPDLATFIALLHREGIYFRSLHLGNILQLPDGRFGLIDFLDLRKKRRRLTQGEIKRNFMHLSNYLDRRKLEAFPLQRLIDCYENCASQ
ncbi:toluene tolerance protein [Azomonas macrocytogenes]|uniref:Toluene tolerance protein n=1 Tax=Azomonas macrocytogenes TaxID=69962 RepID=A0A839T207_AZOMA|nr:toluene tolerance protein [Azomonas macrocytogenes]MBB3102660.1 hypothetical protein [Azomonas macrocytogenes]